MFVSSLCFIDLMIECVDVVYYFRQLLKGVYTVDLVNPPLFGESDKLIDFEGFVMDFGGF